MTIYSGWTDDRTEEEKNISRGYCPNCEAQNYAYGIFRGDICPLCNETVLEYPPKKESAK